MQITKQTDVVFGQLVSGRSSSGVDAKKVVGPCVNIVPIRVRHQEDGNLLAFLQMVQQLHVDSIEFESASFQDIVANCTDWSSETTFGSVLHHVDMGEEFQFSMDHIDCTGRIFSELSIPDDIWITSTLRQFDLEVDLLTSNWNLSPSLAEDVVLKLCDTIHTICSDPEKPVGEVFPMKGTAPMQSKWELQVTSPPFRKDEVCYYLFLTLCQKLCFLSQLSHFVPVGSPMHVRVAQFPVGVAGGTKNAATGLCCMLKKHRTIHGPILSVLSAGRVY